MPKLYNYIKENYILLCILIISAVLRIYHIDFQSLWIDEINSMVQANPNQSFMETYRSLSMDLQPPLYFYLLKYLFCLFGYTTVVLRLFSAVIGIAGVFALYLLAKEMFSKTTGIYAALIIAVNFFHIHYSQEARPYTFLFLFTTLSFFGLIRFIKKTTYKSAVFYSLMACLMLYGHPYGLFSLFSQYLILLVCLVQTKDKTKWLFFKQCLLAGLITIILYVPALQLFMSAAGIKSFWIPAPGPDVYTLLLSEFFGRSEMLVSVVYILILFFFVNVFNDKNDTVFLDGIRTNALPSAFTLLVFWLVAGLLIPLIRSYLQVPMIVPRYLIGLLPAIVIIVAVGLSRINQQFLRTFFILLIVLFSFTDLFVVRDYYNKITKSQLREITGFIKENNKGDVTVVSDLWWHYRFFLDTTKYNLPIISPEDFVNDMMLHPDKIKPFWYSSGHQYTFEKLSEARRAFLNEKFYIAQKLDLIGAWAIHFIPKKDNKQLSLNIGEFQPFNAGSGSYIFLYNNLSTRSTQFTLDKGYYTLYVEGNSEPEQPINNIHAHITIKLNDRMIGGIFLDGKKYPGIKTVNFYVPKTEQMSLEFIFDNDLMLDGKDRNALIYSARIEQVGGSSNK